MENHRYSFHGECFGKPSPLYSYRRVGAQIKVTVDLFSGVHIPEGKTLGNKAYVAKKAYDYITGLNTVYTMLTKEKYSDSWHCNFHTYKESFSLLFSKLELYFNRYPIENIFKDMVI